MGYEYLGRFGLCQLAKLALTRCCESDVVVMPIMPRPCDCRCLPNNATDTVDAGVGHAGLPSFHLKRHIGLRSAVFYWEVLA